MKNALFLDLDKTIIPIASEMGFVSYLFGRKMVSFKALAELGRFFLYHRLGMVRDYKKAKRTLARIVMKGKGCQEYHAVYGQYFEEKLRPLIYPEIYALVKRHRAQGQEVYIISASMDFIVKRVADHLGVDGFYAIEAESRHGVFTGEILEPILFQEEKAVVIRELARTRNLDLLGSHAYSDSHLDEPMLSAVGNPVAVNPDQRLRSMALARKWPIVQWRSPAQPPALA